MMCRGCNKVVPNDQKFCGSCGAPMGGTLLYKETTGPNTDVVARKQIKAARKAFSTSYKLQKYLESLDYGDTNRNDMEKILIIERLNDKTIELLEGALVLLRVNLFNAAQTLLRPIIENITTQFYLELVETDLDNYKTKLSSKTPNQSRKKYDKESMKIESEYRLSNMVDKLYLGDSKATMKWAINLHNSSIHPDPRMDYQKNPKDDFLIILFDQIPVFSGLNLLARVQSYRNTQYEHKVFLETNKQFSDLLQKNSVVLGRYVPNRHNIVNDLMFGDFLKIQK